MDVADDEVDSVRIRLLCSVYFYFKAEGICKNEDFFQGVVVESADCSLV